MTRIFFIQFCHIRIVFIIFFVLCHIFYRIFNFLFYLSLSYNHIVCSVIGSPQGMIVLVPGKVLQHCILVLVEVNLEFLVWRVWTMDNGYMT